LDRCFDSICAARPVSYIQAGFFNDGLFIAPHVTLSIEYSSGFYLQFTGINVSVHNTVAAQLQKVLRFNIAGHLSDNIGLVTRNIAFYSSAGTNYNFSGAAHIADDRSIDPEIAIAANVTFYGCAGTD
jgi:hypothetical protein